MTENSHNFCSKCGQKLNSNEKFCGNCGYKLGDNPEGIKPTKSLLDIITDNLIIILFIFAILAGLFIVIKEFGRFDLVGNYRLPNEAKQLLPDDTEIITVSKARYPENFDWGLGMWYDVDEILCITYSRSSWGTWKVSDVLVRKGAIWKHFSGIFGWDQIGCRHEYINTFMK